MQPGRARTSGPGVPLLPLARWVGWVAPVRPTHGVLVLSLGRPTCVQCPEPLGPCSPVCPRGLWCCVCGVQGSCLPVCSLGVLCCVCGILGHLAPVHRCARWVCFVACAVSWATWVLFTGAPARCVALRVRCPGPLGSCSPVCPLGVLCCVCGVLRHLVPDHRCARVVCCVVCAVSWATWLLFTGVPTRCVVLRVRCPGPLGSCSPVCPLGVLCCACGVLGHLAPVHRCARCVGVLRVRCPGPLGSCPPVCPLGVLCCACGVLRPLGSCSPVCPLGGLCCACGVLGHSAPVHLCARSVCCFACAVSWAAWLRFTGAAAPSFALLVRCPGPLGSFSPVCPLGVLFCVCGVLGHLAHVHRCAHSVCCFACALSWATWLLFTGVPARCVVLRVRCPGPLGTCSPVCPLPHLLCSCGVLGHSAPVHRCARLVCCFACAVSWAT